MPDDILDESKESLDSSNSDAVDANDLDTGREADSSSADNDGDDSLLSVVRNVLDARPEATGDNAAAGSQPDQNGAQAEAEVPPSNMDPDTESFHDVPFHKHPRFQQVLAERRAFREDAERYQNVQNFLVQNNLNGDEAAELLTIGGLMKTNPREAWLRARPVVEKLMIAAGELLPPDLDQRVQQGDLPADDAYALSTARAAAESQQRQYAWQQQLLEQERQRAVSGALQTAASMWEGGQRAADPAFEKKLPLLRKELVYMQSQEGKPTDAAGVKSQLDRALRAVNEQFRLYTPPAPKPAKQPITGGTGAVNGAAKPKSVMDLINQTVEARAH